jgi:catechol 2,3-dioxygenase-like lactoylglutathione lyase family enzyme
VECERSREFYQNLLGMRVAGDSENYGPEQEHLNNVFGAHLQITSLRGPQGIGIEFLEYLAPRDGRKAS